MFQSLSQGSVIPILFKNPLRVVDGKIISVNTHPTPFNPSQPLAMMNGPVTDITVQTGNDTIPFAGLPPNGVVANFPEKGIFIAMDKSYILRELDSLYSATTQQIEQMPALQKTAEDCKNLMLELQPEKQKEAVKEKEMQEMRSKVSNMDEKLDKFMAAVSAKLGI